jgi:hypothetical protein
MGEFLEKFPKGGIAAGSSWFVREAPACAGGCRACGRGGRRVRQAAIWAWVANHRRPRLSIPVITRRSIRSR